MTSQTDEIHKLIADIDSLLANSGNRLSKLLSGQGQEDKAVLQRVRDFLVKLNESEESAEIAPKESDTPPLSSLLTRFVEQEQNQTGSHSYQSQQEQSNFTAGQLKDDISVLLQPLQAELSGLLQERATLVQEIRQLEQKRLQNYSLTQQLANQEQIIAEFLQVLISRLVPNLIPHLARSWTNSPSTATGDQNQEVVNSTIQPVLESAESMDRLASLARELDQRLLSLDGTVNVVFGSLERNINTYHQSLSQALTRMHNQGMQGEQLMANFLSNLTQYLQQQSPDAQPFVFGVNTETAPLLASLEVQPAAHTGEELIPDLAADTEEATIVENLDTVLSELTTEQPPASVTATFTTANELQPESADEVDQLYASLFSSEDAVTPSVVTSEVSTPETDAPLQSQVADSVPASPNVSLFSSEDAVTPSVVTSEVSTPETDAPLESQVADSVPASPNVSLFSSEDAVTPLVVTSEVSTPETDAPLESQLTDSVPASPTIPELPEDDLLVPSEPVEQKDLNLLDQSNNFLLESPGAVIESTEQASELWEELLLPEDTEPQAEFASTDTIPKLLNSHPDSSDIIAVLTDLLVESTSEEQLLEVLSLEDDPETTALQTPIITSVVEEPTEKQDLLLASYISASPEENLLPLENTEMQGVPEIVLDEAQLQQLNRDLANFDWQFNSGSEQTTNLESFQNSLDESQDMLVRSWSIPESPSIEPIGNIPVVAASDLDILQSEVDVDLSQDTEKKKEVTNSELEATLLVDDNLNDNSQVSVNDLDSVWYLGIDLGTTGISAALLNHSRLVVYPIYWSAETQLGETSFEQSFRLPAEVYLPTAVIPHSAESTENIEQTVPAVVAQDNLAQNSTGSRSTPEPKHHLYSAHLKPYLHVAIPYKTTQQKWEPVLQLNEFSAGPLIWVVRSLSKLLLTLKSNQTSTTPALIAHAVGIDPETFSQIINNVVGIVCTCPSSWSEQYRFNVREAILTSKLVAHAQQIFFVEEAIASLLPELDPANSQSVQLNTNQGLRPLKTSENPIQGNTLALNIGATSTEMALVDLPTDLSQLTYRDFMLHSFAYAGKAIEQDIICQLLLPPKSRQPRGEIPADSNTSTSNPSLREIPGLDQMEWSSLSWEGLELPRVGEPDIPARIRFQQRLESSLLGQALLDAAVGLKLILQHQESFTLELADQRWVLQRRDLESQVFVPYVRRLNRELNKLLVARGVPTEAINQAILSGGVAAVSTINRWLRQKLPNAKIIQDLYLGENGAPNCSRVAYGLAMLPLHSQVLEIPRQQYTDYFLFTELLKLLPDTLRGDAIRSLSFGEVLQLFERRGINTRTCQQRLLAFLEGELPPGLIPAIFAERVTESDLSQTSLNSIWLTKSSQENPDYQAIASAPLFEKQGNLSYRPISQQLLFMRRYLDAIKASTLQSLDEPYTVNFALSVNPLH